MIDNSNTTMPVLFVGHGSPMNAIEDNKWSRGFSALAALMPRPKAILSISAHWFVPGLFLTGGSLPKTIHDFGGFPDELYRIGYPAPGSPALAEKVAGLLGGRQALVTEDWGLDHGTWTVLRHLYPKADIPVVQLSIDRRLPPADHAGIGRLLIPLRGEGVLIFASGNIVHNLPYVFSHYAEGEAEVPRWAEDFDGKVARALEINDLATLANALSTPVGRLSHPTPDHYLPLLYAAGATTGADAVRFPTFGFDMGSLSMRAVIFG